jgi:hypothetical protein
MNLIRWTCIAGMVVLTVACSGTTEADSSAKVGAIRLSVSSSSDEVARGSPITFRVILLNEGAEAATLHFGDSCQIVPTIRNAWGEVALPSGGRWGCATVITQLTLLPGEPVIEEYVWTGSTAFQSEMPLRPLPPGAYFFTAEVPQGAATLKATRQVTLK